MIGIVGAGAFGTALGVALASESRDVVLWARDATQVADMASIRENKALPGVRLPPALHPAAALEDLSAAQVVLLTLPMQALHGFLDMYQSHFSHKILVACCKGIDLSALTGPSHVIARTCPSATPAVLTGPSFAADIARGLPTALTLACDDPQIGEMLQRALSTPALRLYRTTDVTGAELGGALKNVIAIACGVAIGAGLGESARAALMARGFAEMQRLALARGAQAETLMGLSGFGDLVLTCTSAQSRNFRHGLALGKGEAPPAATVEGVATAQAVARLAGQLGLEMPVTAQVAALVTGRQTVKNALESLLTRPLKEE
ncbi:NAD(P)H-dependent glycerol-3-phosphate dehydrogenase [Neogemmobacter tilapiae]|uniref:Glycerol-3-phosphate dehydrogenase [NAD(P)+] n=1 Tax=Neogemmobacter tilapiae TaxID=875041 RepID=A0A918TLP0_9RHOB|nr:NAD(P)H-dependent glycerol-3-phosphate dehydrogenase [Gemmobacter tilapiae]GHC51470.1 glycerol-3-phosphate dehydrogenase [NAD(P)+] [Gemmobacter tilapiae]